MCFICLLGQMRLTWSEHSWLFSRDKVAEQRRGKDLNCPSLGLSDICSLHCDETESVCEKFTKWCFTIFLYLWRANLMTKHLFSQNRQINEVGQPCQITWQDAELVNMSSQRQQPQMLSSHLALNPNVAHSQRPLGLNPTDMNNFLTWVIASV